MAAADVEIASRFGTALEQAARTGDWTAVYPYLAPDVEWITPRRTLTGIDEIRNDLIWGSPPEHLDVEFEVGDWRDLGDGRVVVEVRQIYRMKGSGDFAYQRDRRIEVTVRDGKIGRYEMELIG
jgi:hypothetical protein